MDKDHELASYPLVALQLTGDPELKIP